MAIQTKRIFIVLALIFTVLLGGLAAWIGWRITQGLPILPWESGAASQEVWNAEVPKTQEERIAFANGWKQLQESPDFTFEKAKEYALAEGGRFAADTPILTVGEETLYGNDLNYYMILHRYSDYVSSEPLPEAELDFVLDILITDSGLLQEASKIDLIDLTDDIYNTPNKDYTKRNLLATEARDLLADKVVQKIDFEYITIWYQNTDVPVSKESGKALAQTKMDALYSKIESGEITMKEAGEMIDADAEIGTKIDPAYQNNSYSYIERWEKGLDFFNDPELEHQLWSLGEGQFTKVLTGIDSEINDDAFFIVIRMVKRNISLEESTGASVKESTEDLVNDTRDAAEKESEILIQKGR